MIDERPPVVFIADALGLDFVNSYSTPHGIWTDWVTSGEDLLKWCVSATIISDDTARRLRSKSGRGELDAVAAEARTLRKWFRAFVNRHKGSPLDAISIVELTPLNRVLARDRRFGQIVPGKQRPVSDGVPDRIRSRLYLEMKRPWGAAEILLYPLAQAMADLICDDDFTCVKSCEGHKCALFFIDRTRSRTRRWCDMAVCGNRTKQSAHRKKS